MTIKQLIVTAMVRFEASNAAYAQMRAAAIEAIALAPKAPWMTDGRLYSPRCDRILNAPSVQDRVDLLFVERDRLYAAFRRQWEP